MTFHTPWLIARQKTAQFAHALGYCFVFFLCLGAQNMWAKDTTEQPAPIIINVVYGGKQPPFVIESAEDDPEHSGLAKDLLDAMNVVQNQYEFRLNVMFPQRVAYRYEAEGIDLVAFSNLMWSWGKLGAQSSRVLYEDGDWYVALRHLAADAFADPTKHSIIIIPGFSYAFAGYETEFAELEKKFDVVAASNEAEILSMLVHRRAEMGVMAGSMIEWLNHSQPDLFEDVVQSQRADHEFDRSFIVLPGADITVQQVDQIIAELARHGQLQEIYDRYGLTLPAALRSFSIN